MKIENNLYTIHNNDYKNIIPNLKNKVDCIITDPPYNISKNNNFNTIKDKKGNQKYNSIDFGEWDKDFNINEYLDICLPSIKKSGSFISFMDWKDISIYVNILEKNKYLVKQMLQWIKPNTAPKNRDRLYITNYEIAIWATNGKDWTFNRQNSKMQIPQFYYPFVSGNEKTIHPTQKPVKLIRELIKIHTNPGDIILDPFMGSGSIGEAALLEGRKYIGVEISPEYFEISKKRLSNFNNKIQDEW